VEDRSNETVFEFPATTTLYLLPAAIVSGVFVLVEVFSPSRDNLALAILGIVVGTVELIYFGRLRYRVGVGDAGIRYMPYGGAPIFLAWNELAHIELRESAFAAHLVVSDSARLRNIRIDYRLEKFEELLSVIVDRASNCDPHPTLPAIFHASYLDQAITIGVFFLCVGLSICFALVHESLNSGAFGLFSLLPIGIFISLPHQLTVAPESSALVYLGWRREIPIASISGVRFGIKRGSRGALWTVIWVDRIEGKSIQLTGFREGTLAVYYALREAWRPFKESGIARAAITGTL